MRPTLADPAARSLLVVRLGRVHPESARRWGRMTAPQMIAHLADAFRIYTGEIVTAPRTGFLQRTVVKWIALEVPFPWPPGIPTSPEVDALRAGFAPAEDFAAGVATVEALIDRVGTAAGGGLPHPIFGALTVAQWRRWGWLHVDHHLRQFGA